MNTTMSPGAIVPAWTARDPAHRAVSTATPKIPCVLQVAMPCSLVCRASERSPFLSGAAAAPWTACRMRAAYSPSLCRRCSEICNVPAAAQNVTASVASTAKVKISPSFRSMRNRITVMPSSSTPLVATCTRNSRSPLLMRPASPINRVTRSRVSATGACVPETDSSTCARTVFTVLLEKRPKHNRSRKSDRPRETTSSRKIPPKAMIGSSPVGMNPPAE